MWTGVESYPPWKSGSYAMCAKKAARKCAGASFAFCAAHMDDVQVVDVVFLTHISADTLSLWNISTY